MSTQLLIYFKEDSLEFWTQNVNGQTVPFQYKGSHELPLYFLLNGDNIVAGSFARDQFRQKGNFAAGGFYSQLEDPVENITRFNHAEPAANLLFHFLKEELLPSFALQTQPDRPFEQFLRSGRVRLLFDYCLTEMHSEALTRGFIEVVGLSPTAISGVSYWEVFRRLVARKYAAESQCPIASVFAAFGDLCFCLVSKDAPFVMSRKVVTGRGADPRLDLLSEILAEKAIEKGGSLLGIDAAKKEVLPQATVFLDQLESGMVEGNVVLSDTGKIHVQFLTSILAARMDNRSSLNLIGSEFDAFKRSNQLQDTAIFLLGDILNDAAYQQFFQTTYSHVFPEWPGYKLELMQECFTLPVASSIPHVGIDLGTTFSCMSYVDESGRAVIIANSDGQTTTPSIIWFDGKTAYVGKKAADRKIQANAPIFEFVKRDMGEEGRKRYVINGFDYKARGLSSLILKKLRNEAFQFFKKKGLLPAEESAKTLAIPAVITVPAYFGDKQRQETRCAGDAAGLDVIAVINEPTAAALTYGVSLLQKQRLLVFDLGGGTFDITILEVDRGEARVVATDGIDQLGGKDWDMLLQEYLFKEFERQTGTELPDDMAWDIQRMALEIKCELSEEPEVSVTLNAAGETAELTFYRERADGVADNPHGFYFEERAAKLLAQCRKKLSAILEKSNLTWSQIDEILLAGGSSRMPMIPKLIESVSGRSVKRTIEGFSYDTAISQGAALFGVNRGKVVDVCSKSIGIEVEVNGELVVQKLIHKNSPLPVSSAQTFNAEHNATLHVYEGEGSRPDTCQSRGEFELSNPAGRVTVTMSVDVNGVIHATVASKEYSKSLRIAEKDDCEALKTKIETIDIR